MSSTPEAVQFVNGAPIEPLLQKHYGASLRLALGILREYSEAEDAVQSAYSNAVRHLSGFREESSFSTWISRIVVNQCLMRLRQLRRTSTVSLEDVPVEPAQAMYAGSVLPGPHEMFERREAAAAIRHALDRLPTPLSRIWMLHELEGLSMRDLSDALGISVAAAKSRLFRARAALRELLSVRFGQRPFAAA